MSDNYFYLNISKALMGCQLVEQELKLYLTEAIEFAKLRLKGDMPFNWDGKDFDDSSLENLIKQFKKYSNNPQLAAELDSFKKERNFLSHKAIASCLDPSGELSPPERSSAESRAAKLCIDADRLTAQIHSEGAGFRARLLFGDD